MNVTQENGPDQRFRLVFDTATSTVASPAMADRQQALTEFDRAVAQYVDEIAAEQLRIRVLRDDVWTQRSGQDR